MIREEIAPREGWQAKVEACGLRWHTVDGRPYWNEAACYRFAAAEIDEIEAATAELYRLFIAAGQAIVDDPDGLAAFGIPDHCHDAIRAAWAEEPPALNYGRFDLGYDGHGPPKLFEFNCDTPTALLEAAVIQWDWKAETFPALDQYNSLHPKLVGKWADIRTLLPGREVVFTHVADAIGEDAVTTAYLRDTAHEAGLTTDAIAIDEIGWDADRRQFVDRDGARLATLFKLYPWEWLVEEAFGRHLIDSLDRTIWIEPIRKMIWSNNAILPVLWSMFPEHPNLLYASFAEPFGDHVRKPRLAREGANVTVMRRGRRVAGTGGGYGGAGWVYQDLFALPETAPGRYPVIGSWVVDGAPAGMGLREDGLVTGNAAQFVPHVIDG